MKRLIVVIIIFLNVNLFAKEPVLILKKDSVIEDTSGNEKMFSKGDRFLFGQKGSDGSEWGFGVHLDDPLTIEIYFRDYIIQSILILPGLIVLRYKDFILMIFILYILVSLIIITMLIF